MKYARNKMNRKKVDEMVISSHEPSLRTEPAEDSVL